MNNMSKFGLELSFKCKKCKTLLILNNDLSFECKKCNRKFYPNKSDGVELSDKNGNVL